MGANAEFVYQMEGVLSVFTRSSAQRFPADLHGESLSVTQIGRAGHYWRAG